MITLKRLLIALCLLSAPLWAQTPPPSGIIAYSVDSKNCSAPCVLPTYEAWFPAHFKFIVAPGMDLSSYLGSANAMPTYVNSNIQGMQLYPYVWATYATQGWANPETALLHMTKADYSPAGGVTSAYYGIDQFDAFEQSHLVGTLGNPLNAVHGVFTRVGSTYTDVSVRAFCPDTSCSSYHPNPVTVSDRLLIGYQNPFDVVNFTIGTGRVGGTPTYQYWNGASFTALTPVSDTTSGLASTGVLTFAPPSDWAPAAIQGSYSKYWIQVTISGASTNPVISKIYGDNLVTTGCAYGNGSCARAWKPSACVSGHINIGTPLEYCAVPVSTATARFRWQARAVGYGSVDTFYPLPNNQIGGKYTWPYVEQTNIAAQLARYNYAVMNGVMFDNAGFGPGQTPTFNPANSDLNGTTYQAACIPMFSAAHALLQAQYGAGWWDGVNLSSTVNQLGLTESWALMESATSVENSYQMSATLPLMACTNSAWCRGSPINQNPLNTEVYIQVFNTAQFQVLDANGTALSNWHSWDMSQRGPISALAMGLLMRNPNVILGYDPSGYIYGGFDEYYYWVTSSATLAAPGITASTCTSACSIPLSAPLGVSCPGVLSKCPIRIGGAGGTITNAASYSGSTLYTRTSGPHSVILASEPTGSSIEYAVLGHQSQDIPLNTPIAMYGYHVPAYDINFGTPDATNGFDTPCTSNQTFGYVNGGCIALNGSQATGNLSGCNHGSGAPPNYNCSPLLRRDFTAGAFGNTIVLMRPVSISNSYRTASTEYDTPGVPYALSGTYYPLNSDGTVGATPLTSVTLRGGESVILVANY